MPMQETATATETQDIQFDAFDLAFDAAASELPPEPAPEPAPIVEPTPESTAPEPVPEPAPAPAPQAVQPAPPPPAPEPPAAQPPPPSAPEPEAFKFSTEEQALFDTVAETYPEVMPLFELMEKKILATRDATRKQALAEASASLTQQLAPVFNETQVSARSRWESAVLGKHADAFTVLPQLEEWVKKQPAILQPAYNAVLDRGTPEETVELLDVFKKSSEYTPPQPPPPAVDPAVEERLNAQEGVKSRRTVDRGSALDPNDFDSAFDRFAGKASV